MSNLTTEQKRKQRIALDFLAGRCTDHLGRKIDDYFNFTEQQMEDDHEWIQWAFPISTVSPHNPHAGLFFGNVAKHYHNDKNRCEPTEKLLRKYLFSIGITYGKRGYPVGWEKATVYSQSHFYKVVNSPHNHHVKRISRVLAHLVLIGADSKARDLLYVITKDLIRDRPHHFSAYTVAYWNAVVYDYERAFK